MAPSRTKDLCPSSVHASPAPEPARVTSSSRHEPVSSASATAPTLSPLAIAGSRSLLSRVVAECLDQGRGHHARAEERRDGQRATELLEHEAELDEGEAAAPELLGDRQTLQAELVAHAAPQVTVVTGRVLELFAHGRLGGVLDQEPAQFLLEFGLFVVDREVHWSSLPGAERLGHRAVLGCVVRLALGGEPETERRHRGHA